MKTATAARVLEAVLRRLRPAVGENGRLLARFAQGSVPTNEARVPPPPVEMAVSRDGIEDRIRSAYFALTNGAVKQRVLLKDLRPRVDAPREELDRALMTMQAQRKLVLMGLDNPRERTSEDDEAALYIAGNPRHLLYFQD